MSFDYIDKIEYVQYAKKNNGDIMSASKNLKQQFIEAATPSLENEQYSSLIASVIEKLKSNKISIPEKDYLNTAAVLYILFQNTPGLIDKPCFKPLEDFYNHCLAEMKTLEENKPYTFKK